MSFRLSQRDKDIIGLINQFRAVDRDSLVELFFKQLKSPVNACNSVMVRLYRLGLIERLNAHNSILRQSTYLWMRRSKRTLKKYYISFLSWMFINKCARIVYLRMSL
ncbi:hypothetical protein AB3N02_29675 [Priestia aryabhattai]|uniref:hypothetical protein n=1 Tax=Priestia aryabhattai TaxID=412384 RepID=UPI00399FD889